MPEAPRCQPDVPGDFGQAPSACGLDPRSQVTRARFRGPARSTGCPGASGPGPRPCEVDRLSRGNRALAQGPAGSTSCPGTLALGSEVPRDRPTVPADSGSAPMPAGSQLSGPPVLESEGPRCRPVLPGQSGPGLRGRGVDKRSWVTPGRVRGPMSFTSLPGDSGPGPGGPSVMTSCSERFGPGSECPRCRPALPCDSLPCPRARGVDKQSLETPGQVRGPTGSTSWPGRPRPGSEGPQCRPAVQGTRAGSEGPQGRQAVPGESCPGPRAGGVNQITRATRART